MTGININELQQARYMGLSCPPASSEAKSLVDSIMIIILKSEHAIAFKSAVGLRLGEASGLERSHVDLSPDAPHLIIEETDNRRLKTKTSKRRVPLVGAALWATRRAVEASLRNNTPFSFPKAQQANQRQQ